MARKVNHKEKGREVDEPEIVVEEEGDDWRSWSKGTYAKSWYLLLCLFVDVMIALQVEAMIDDAIGTLVLFGIMALLLFLEVKVFLYLWGRDGIWRLPSED